MAVSTALALDNAIRRGEIRCNFKGIALGDSWISPVDIVATYPQYLQSFVSIVRIPYLAYTLFLVFDRRRRIQKLESNLCSNRAGDSE